MSFTDYLCTLPLDRLKEIIRRRAFQIRSVPRIASRRDLCAWLAQTLSDAYAVRRAFEETDLLEARLLTYVVAQGGSVSWSLLAKAFGAESLGRIEVAADGLESLGLAIVLHDADGWNLWTPDAVRRNVPLPLPVRHRLQPTLERYEGPALAHLVGYLGLGSAGGTSKATRAVAVARLLLDEEGLQRVLGARSDEARSLLDFVVRRGGVTNLHELGLKLDTRRRNQLYSYDWSYRWYGSAPRNPVEELLSSGLLVLEGSVGFHYGAILIPGDLLERITGQNLVSGTLPALPEWEVVSPDGKALRSHESLNRDIAFLLGYLARNPTSRTGKGIIHRTALKTVAKSMTIPGPAYSTLIYALCQESGIIDTIERDESFGITQDGEAWLESERQEQTRVLYRTWLGQMRWVEAAADLLLEDGFYVDANDVRSMRDTVVGLITEFSREHPSALVEVRSLVARARYRRWAFFPPDPEPSEDTDEGEDALGGKDLVARVILALYSLGMLEVESTASGEFTQVRLTQLGRLLLINEPLAGGAPEVETFVVQPNMEIYAPPNLTARLYYGLFRLAEPKGSGMLALSRDSLRKALDRDMTTSGILDFLRSHSSTGLPQNVEYLVKEVGGKHGHVRVGHAGLYLVVDDPILLKELAAQKKLSISIRRQLADTVALVTGESVDAVLKQLRAAGYLPVADRDEAKRGTKKRSARKAYQTGDGESAASILGAIHWDRLAKEEAAKLVPDTGVTARAEIRELVETALSERRRLEYSFSARPSPDQKVVAEPVGLAGSLLRAYLPARRHFAILNIAQMRWANLTGETFEPKKEPAELFE